MQIEKYRLVDAAGTPGDELYDDYSEAERAAGSESAIEALKFDYTDAEIIYTPCGSDTWPPPSEEELLFDVKVQYDDHMRCQATLRVRATSEGAACDIVNNAYGSFLTVDGIEDFTFDHKVNSTGPIGATVAIESVTEVKDEPKDLPTPNLRGDYMAHMGKVKE